MIEPYKKQDIIGLFKDENDAVSAIQALRAYRFKIRRVHSPFSNHRIMEALKIKKSPVGWITLLGGAIGFFSGLGLAAFTALRWSLIIGGHPVLSWIPFIVIGFELTILFSVALTMLGMLWMSGLPEFETLKEYDPRVSGSYYGIIVSCMEGEEKRLEDLFRKYDGETRVFHHENHGS